MSFQESSKSKILPSVDLEGKKKTGERKGKDGAAAALVVRYSTIT